MLGFYPTIVKLTRNAPVLWRSWHWPSGLTPVLQVGPPVMAATLLHIAIAPQRTGDVRICPDPANLFIDILAKVGYVEDTTAIVKSRIS